MPAKRDMVKKIILPCLLVLLLVGHAFLVNTGWKDMEEQKPYQVVPSLNLEWMKLISLDQERLVSLLLSLYLLAAAPVQSYEWDYRGLLSYMRVISGLDPHNKAPFFFAVHFMSFRTDTEGRMIFSYLDESRETFPDDWKLPWQASYVAKIRFKDSDLAYHYALKAANAPHAPPIVKILPALLMRNLGDIETAHTYLVTLREYSADPKEIEAIDGALEQLEKQLPP
jgi:hypothetical protein